MATLRDIRRRIKAVRNTRQITKAMKMVAAAKLRRAQGRMLELRPYADKMYGVIENLGAMGDMELNPLLAVRPRKTVGVLVLTSDRGLCGAFNTNIMKAAAAFISDLKSQGFDVSVSAVGRKAIDYFRRRDVQMRSRWAGISGKIDYLKAREIAGDLIENFRNETLDEVHLVYNEFVNVVIQKVQVKKLLPLSGGEGKTGPSADAVDFIYEPSAKQIYGQLIPKAIEIEVFRALLESQTSEEAARMTAMENASKNADEMIQRLTLVANKVRQATITKELMDIVGGVEALK
ncbi:MAG: ATP synthase F1 subunit gamma [Nitrospiraceae bacterium]|nr:ATP synthase F1 subunit gamma [Nitrospiraceae bacterium]